MIVKKMGKITTETVEMREKIKEISREKRKRERKRASDQKNVLPCIHAGE